MFEFLQKNCAWLFIHNQWLVQTEWHPSRWHWLLSLHWHHNGRDSVSNRQPRDCLLNRLFRRRSKKTSKLRVTGLCAGNSPGTGEFPAQMASNAENVSIWWRHHVVIEGVAEFSSTGYNEFVSLWSYALEITRIYAAMNTITVTERLPISGEFIRRLWKISSDERKRIWNWLTVTKSKHE